MPLFADGVVGAYTVEVVHTVKAAYQVDEAVNGRTAMVRPGTYGERGHRLRHVNVEDLCGHYFLDLLYCTITSTKLSPSVVRE